MEDHRTACTLIRKNDWLAVIDQRDAYHAIPVNRAYQKYLKFRWQNKLYQFTCLPFGLNIAPFIYTKLMRPVLSTLRCDGVNCVSFLDDCLLIACSKIICESLVKHVCIFYASLGLTVNYDKSQLAPSQTVQFLGFMFHSRDCSLSLPSAKANKVYDKCDKLSKNNACTILYLAELVGMLVSVCPAVSYGSLYLKQLEFEKSQALKLNNFDYSQNICISQECINDLNWWLRNIRSSKRSFITDCYDLRITTDASLTGYGIECNGDVSKGCWTVNDSQKHINELELIAIKIGLQTFANQAKRVLIRSDNNTAIAYVNNYGGCRSSSCHKIAKSIWQWCEAREIIVFASYIHTKQNVIADSLSREEKDNSDFSLTEKYFKNICSAFGYPTVDLFASHLTHRLEKYISWFPDPLCSGVDAFTQQWEDGFYAFPPFCLVARVLRKICEDCVTGIVVVPLWTAQAWYPLYCSLSISEKIILEGNDLLWCPYMNRFHPLSRGIKLMAAVLSAKH